MKSRLSYKSHSSLYIRSWFGEGEEGIFVGISQSWIRELGFVGFSFVHLQPNPLHCTQDPTAYDNPTALSSNGTALSSQFKWIHPRWSLSSLWTHSSRRRSSSAVVEEYETASNLPPYLWPCPQGRALGISLQRFSLPPWLQCGPPSPRPMRICRSRACLISSSLNLREQTLHLSEEKPESSIVPKNMTSISVQSLPSAILVVKIFSFQLLGLGHCFILSFGIVTRIASLRIAVIKTLEDEKLSLHFSILNMHPGSKGIVMDMAQTVQSFTLWKIALLVRSAILISLSPLNPSTNLIISSTQIPKAKSRRPCSLLFQF